MTTAALGLAAYWPLDLTPLLAEADPSGGDLQVLFGLPESPGTVSLAAAAGRSAGPDLLWRHAQWLTPRLAVVPGPAGADQAAATGARLAAGSWAPVTAAAASGAMIVADCGRASPGTPAAPLIQAADVLLIVTTADAAALAHLHARLRRPAPPQPAGPAAADRPARPLAAGGDQRHPAGPGGGPAAARPGRGVGAARPPRPPRPGHPVARPGTPAAADRRRGHRSPARQPPGHRRARAGRDQAAARPPRHPAPAAGAAGPARAAPAQASGPAGVLRPGEDRQVRGRR